MKDSIKNDFLRDYQLAIDAFNRQESTSVLRNIRPAVESICKLVIFDILNDENVAKKILNGEIRSFKGVEILKDGESCESSIFTRIIPTLLDINNFYNKYSKGRDRSRVRNEILFVCDSLREVYAITSNVASHTSSHKLDVDSLAFEYIFKIPNFINKLQNRGVITKNLISLIDGLPKPNMTPQAIIDLETKNVELEKKYNALLEDYVELQKVSKLLEEQKLIVENEKGEIKEKAEEIYKTFTDVKNDFLKKIDELTQDNDFLRGQLDELKEKEKNIIENPNQLFGINMIEDDDQLDLIEMDLSESMLVAGCAGSGKSLIAIKKAQQILKANGDVILIALTRSLKDYIHNGIKDNLLYKSVYTYKEWSKHKKKADYIIVDEIQDFVEKEIKEFIVAARKSYFFFGDTAQSIYKGLKNTLSIEEISKLTKLDPLFLDSNYRLPQPIAKVTQGYIGIDVNKYSDRIYKSKEKELPYIIGYQTQEEQKENIVKILKEKHQKDVGILFYSNQEVYDFYQYSLKKGIVIECKYDFDKNNKNSLNFDGLAPKIMTYHSAKGLQFETVIIPNFTSTTKNDIDKRKAQYVAMTRTYKNLYVMYEGNMPEPLKDIPSHLYIDKL